MTLAILQINARDVILNMIKNGSWKLSELEEMPKNGYKVFSCFHCGGGSTMGYKLAGFDVLGGVEIDKQMAELYRLNHNPQFSYEESIQAFNKKPSYPDELANIDILDGSPPCSSFSTNGSRDKKWGEAHAFREGQAIQKLDDLFFHFIKTAEILQPKIVIAENVKGLILAKARGYVKEIFAGFQNLGYSTQLFLLNSAVMGVPQQRQRVFFIARKEGVPLQLDFKEPLITVKKAWKNVDEKEKPFSKLSSKSIVYKRYYDVKPGGSYSTLKDLNGFYSYQKIAYNRPAPTIAANGAKVHPKYPRYLNRSEISALQTFPTDYNFNGLDPSYVCGMSVPPYMIQRIALEVKKQWLN
jgi:DNA (cytosine-5)-methyltransferase 1